MKLEPHLPQLPSIGELLEHPRVKGVVARINRSTLAQRAAGFLEEWRSSLAERAGRIELPSVTDLADRLARRLLGDSSVEGPVINATGLVVGDPALAPPLADAAVHAMMHVGSDFHSRETPLRHAIERNLCILTGAEAALAVSSYDAALTLVLAATAANREALVCGGEDSAASGVDWQWLAARNGAVLRAVASDRATIASTAAASSRLAAIVREPTAKGALPITELSPVAKERGACLLDVAGDAGLLNPARHGFKSVDTLSDRVAAGADVVITDAAGLVGGPACGVIIGQRQYVEAAARHPLASLLAVDPLTAAGLHATLAAYRHDTEDGVIFALPVWQLLLAPLANLKQRAERLASLMTQSSGLASAEPREIDSVWRRCGSQSFTAKSWAIDIRPKSGDVPALLAQLRRAPHPIIASEADGAVRVDLRSVFARWDQQLVSALETLAS